MGILLGALKSEASQVKVSMENQITKEPNPGGHYEFCHSSQQIARPNSHIFVSMKEGCPPERRFRYTANQVVAKAPQ
jgi:hypothetical protein